MELINPQPRIDFESVTEDSPLIAAIVDPIEAAEKTAWDERGAFQTRTRRGIRAQSLMLENLGHSLKEFGFEFEEHMSQGRFLCMDRFKYPVRLIPCRGKKQDGMIKTSRPKGICWEELTRNHNRLFNPQVLLIPPDKIGSDPYYVNLMIVSEIYRSYLNVHIAMPTSKVGCYFRCIAISTLRSVDLNASNVVVEEREEIVPAVEINIEEREA